MPPHGRRPYPTRLRLSAPISSAPSPHAASRKSGRQPFEHEGGDELGPAPALDLSPGDAESEAKRMLYEKTHPLHDPVMQGGHINHAYAVKRYQSLMRRAWDPAARSLPIKPMHDAGNRDDREAASILAPSPRAPLIPTGSATGLYGAPIAANDSARAGARNPIVPDVASSSAPLRQPANRSGKAGGTQTAQATPSDGSVNAHTDARAQPPRPQEFGRWGERVGAVLLQDAAYGLYSMREYERWRTTAMASLSATERLRDPVRLTVPHSINETRFSEATQLVYARDDLSDVMKYSLLRIFGYEDTTVNSLNGSRAGLLTSTFKRDWGRLGRFVNAIRVELGKPTLTGQEAVADLSLDDIIDVQKAYLILALVDPTKWETMLSAESLAVKPISKFDLLADFGTGELPAQIADTVYRHGGFGGLKIVQRATNRVIASLPDAERARLGLPESIEDDGEMGDITHDAIAALASSDATSAGFLSAIQFERAREMLRNGEYRGADRRRVWGWHEDRPGL